MRIHLPLLIACTALTLPACNTDHGVDGHEHGDGETGHSHSAPHAHAGGMLVELGDHFLQMEVVPDLETGELRLFFWDGHAENPVRLTQASLQLALTVSGVTAELALSAQASTLTGETVGDSAEFRGKHAGLRGATEFHAVVHQLDALGASFESVPFDYSKGDN
ncbi:MAG TPA: hypothetical protein EYQ74_09265 [Planctomycetes bacterium]|nr:hypothetical protein [Planctomycetota bacterium]HIK61937.1 hypothetical protein [Planctomycetota bacterium]